jgi:NADP-dependent 3-hydroxy acid dehydrogenase YdfG
MTFPYKNVLMIGATSDLGFALVERIIEHGVFVLGVGRRENRLDTLVEKHDPEKVAVFQFDITELGEIASWCRR